MKDEESLCFIIVGGFNGREGLERNTLFNGHVAGSFPSFYTLDFTKLFLILGCQYFKPRELVDLII